MTHIYLLLGNELFCLTGLYSSHTSSCGMVKQNRSVVCLRIEFTSKERRGHAIVIVYSVLWTIYYLTRGEGVSLS